MRGLNARLMGVYEHIEEIEDNNWLFFIWKISREDTVLGVEKTSAQHDFFKRLTTHPSEIFFI